MKNNHQVRKAVHKTHLKRDDGKEKLILNLFGRVKKGGELHESIKEASTDEEKLQKRQLSIERNRVILQLHNADVKAKDISKQTGYSLPAVYKKIDVAKMPAKVLHIITENPKGITESDALDLRLKYKSDKAFIRAVVRDNAKKLADAKKERPEVNHTLAFKFTKFLREAGIKLDSEKTKFGTSLIQFLANE